MPTSSSHSPRTPYEIIAAKRDGRRLSAGDIADFVAGFMRGEVADYQMTAFLMAVYWRGMDFSEISALTRAYIDSGITVDLSDISLPRVDKHSTGGVGDKVSMILAPMVACAGVAVPMISGRGLGHSGGTLDKLESIPGFNTALSVEQFKQLVSTHGMALIGQTADLVPADKHIYALRDVTATVDCLPLISASIMSKKIAEGIDGLVLDVKYGSGAFMKTAELAQELAETLIRIGGEFDKQVVAVLTSMEQPLGHAVGNWLEIRECLECLQGQGPQDLMEVTYALGAQMLLVGKVCDDAAEARRRCRESIESGKAFQKFLEICAAQGAETTCLEKPDSYPLAKERHVLKASSSGFISAMNTFEIGMAAVQLGAGRLRAEDQIDPQAGIIVFRKIGEKINTGEPLVEIHTNRSASIEPVLGRLKNAITISETPPPVPELILKTLTG